MAKCATQSKRRAIFQVRVNRRERKVVSEGKIVLSGRQRQMVAEQLDSLHTVADCGRHCQSHFSLGFRARRPLLRHLTAQSVSIGHRGALGTHGNNSAAR